MVPYTISDDYFTVENYLRLKREGAKHNVFLFGNSKVGAFMPESLCENKEACHVYNFGSPGESLVNIRKKLELIQTAGDTIDQAWLILDHQILVNENNAHPYYQGPAYIHHPKVSNQPIWDFHLEELRFFLRDFYFLAYYDYKFFGQWRNYMEGKIINPKRLIHKFDVETNTVEKEEKCASNAKKLNLTKGKPIENTDTCILTKFQLNELDQMKVLLKESKVNIIFGPNRSAWSIDRAAAEINGRIPNARLFDFVNFETNYPDTCMWNDEQHYSQKFGEILIKEVARENYER